MYLCYDVCAHGTHDVFEYIRVYFRACIRMFTFALIEIHTYTYMPYIHTYIHTYIHAYIHTGRRNSDSDIKTIQARIDEAISESSSEKQKSALLSLLLTGLHVHA